MHAMPLMLVSQVAPALRELTRLEEAFWALQQAVGTGHAAAAAGAAAGAAPAVEAAAEQLLAAEGQGVVGDDAGEAAAMGGVGEPCLSDAAAAGGERAGGATPAEATSAEDSLALHLSLSMLFTCCTRVRARFPAALPWGVWEPSTCLVSHLLHDNTSHLLRDNTSPP